jgi:hypothetical protein
MRVRSLFLGAAVAVVASGLLASSAGAVVITSGDFSVGIGANGELSDTDAGVGFRRESDGFDAINFGTQRDSWSANGDYADQQYQGTSGVTTTFAPGAPSTATATTTTDGGLGVAQNYSFAGSNIVVIDTTVTNLSGGDLSLLFGRNVDFDLEQTLDGSFERVFAPGVGGQVSETSYNGFEDTTASNPYFGFFSCSAGCDTTGDLGGGIKLNLGSLGAGQSVHFSYYYGLNNVGQSVGDLIGQTRAAGAKYIIAGESGTDGTNAFTFGVGGVSVPEPATWAMMLMGFFGLGAALRRRRAAIALAA